ncbi:MAG TPA: class I adenylate-forming enzyme family protein [Paenalcaligenes sp.]|nr:class I adenylate-forming enzyme family protein [Paenalcaligenes sp.]
MSISDLQQATAIHHIPQYHAQTHPERLCVIDTENQPISYGELWNKITATSQYLEQQGVRPRDRVLIVGENCVDMMTLYFACSLLQAWPVAVNARLSPREIDVISTHAAPRVSLYTSGISRSAAQHATHQQAQDLTLSALPHCLHVKLDSQQDTREIPSTEAIPSTETTPSTEATHTTAVQAQSLPDADQVAALIYTSGTTGAPKGVMVPHRGLLHFARISGHSRGLGPDDRAYAALPLSHIFGLATVLLATLYAGAALILRSRFDPADVRQALATQGLTTLQGVPMMYTRILAEAAENGPFEAPQLRYVYTGGAALDPTLKQRVEDLFGHPLHHGYGITEYAGSLFLTRQEAPAQDCTAGYAVEGLEIHIGDLNQAPLPPGTVGDIHVRGPGIMLGYYKDPQQTAAAILPGGWLKTGDLGYLAEDGALYITGRSKELIIRSGFNVYPHEVESVLNSYPGINLSAVIGVPEQDGNEKIIAFYQPTEDANIDIEALQSFLRERLAPYKIPAQYLSIDTIPMTLSGKIQKRVLQDRFLNDLNNPATETI